jgi:hypothetical protein
MLIANLLILRLIGARGPGGWPMSLGCVSKANLSDVEAAVLDPGVMLLFGIGAVAVP